MLIALKVEVSTRAGTASGVPRLRHTFDHAGVPATFFLAMGPDRAGNPVRQLASRLTGGHWLPLTGLAHGGVLRGVARDGHEVGLAAWDPVEWRECVRSWSEPEVGAALERGLDAFHEVFGTSPRALATPGGRVTKSLLSVEERLGLDYASDCRGREPFFVAGGARTFGTLQIPGTLPSVDELVGRDGLTAESALDLIERSLDPTRLNVYTARAEHEGGWMAGAFAQFLERVTKNGGRFVRLRDVARRVLHRSEPVPVCSLIERQLIGVSGLVLVQGAQERSAVRTVPAERERLAA